MHASSETIVASNVVENQEAAHAVERPEATEGRSASPSAEPIDALDAPTAADIAKRYPRGLLALCWDEPMREAVARHGLTAARIADIETGESAPRDPWAWIEDITERAQQAGQAADQRSPDAAIRGELIRLAKGRDVVVLGTFAPGALTTAAREALDLFARALTVQTFAHSVRLDLAEGLAQTADEQGVALMARQAFSMATIEEDSVEAPTPKGGWGRKLAPRDPGAALMAELLAETPGSVERLLVAARLPEVKPGFLFDLQDSGSYPSVGDEPSTTPLRVCRERARPGRPIPPLFSERIVKETRRSKDGDTTTTFRKEMVSVMTPYLHRERTVEVHIAVKRVLQVNSPEHPAEVWVEYEGIADNGERKTLRLPASPTDSELAQRGFLITGRHEREAWLQMQRLLAPQKPTVMATRTPGWLYVPKAGQTLADVTPHYAYGGRVIAPANGEALIFDQASSSCRYATAGTFEDWVTVFKLASLSPAVGALTAWLASAPLIHVFGFENGMIHLLGLSGLGKSSLLDFAMTPSGGDVASWGATDNGVMAFLAERNDAPVGLDEAGQADSIKVSTIYALINGQEKQRADRNGNARPVRHSKNQFLSNGEKSIQALIDADARGARTPDMPDGLRFRVIELAVENDPADPSKAIWVHVAQEAQKPGFETDFGAYGELVAAYPESAAADVQGKVIDAIAAAGRANRGQYWPRYIAWLQTPEGIAKATAWRDEYAKRLGALLRPGDSTMFRRRAKHVSALLTSARAMMFLCDFTEDEIAERLPAIEDWAINTLWAAGLVSRSDSETTRHPAEIKQWIYVNENRLYDPALGFRPDGSVGWRDSDGHCYITMNGMAEISKAVGADPRRVDSMLKTSGWTKLRKRWPTGGAPASKNNSIFVWTFESLFERNFVRPGTSPDPYQPPQSDYDVLLEEAIEHAQAETEAKRAAEEAAKRRAVPTPVSASAPVNAPQTASTTVPPMATPTVRPVNGSSAALPAPDNAFVPHSLGRADTDAATPMRLSAHRTPAASFAMAGRVDPTRSRSGWGVRRPAGSGGAGQGPSAGSANGGGGSSA